MYYMLPYEYSMKSHNAVYSELLCRNPFLFERTCPLASPGLTPVWETSGFTGCEQHEPKWTFLFPSYGRSSLYVHMYEQSTECLVRSSEEGSLDGPSRHDSSSDATTVASAP